MGIQENLNPRHFDMIIVGAGLSGIGSACHFKRECPNKSFAVLESRDSLGGTWDLFRYPGIRSDSDMHTLGYNFRPWEEAKAIADGPSILNYINQTSKDHQIESHIRLGHKVIAADWSSASNRWTLTIELQSDKSLIRMTANFVTMCPGYYRYEEGHRPDFKGEENFKGPIIHPQHWPEDLDYEGKAVIVIGSGATAVTLIPQLAKKTKHVIMLQRSPTYVATMPAKDKIANGLRKIFSKRLAYKLTRWKNLQLHHYIYKKARTKPEKTKEYLLKVVQKELGPDYDVATHFSPNYNPWDQRLCLVPDSDMFKSIKSGAASVVTDHIEKFTQKGILLKSGKELSADIIVTATGINISFLGDIPVTVDTAPMHLKDRFGYKGMMFSDVPNLISVFGYTNASWTLKADLIAEYMCRLVNYMDETGAKTATPRAPEGMTPGPWLDFQAGYIQRVIDKLPKQGDRQPWMNKQDYKLDKKILGRAPIDDGVMEFTRAPANIKK